MPSEMLSIDGTTFMPTVDGDEYNCVDIFKQPSLKHPALHDPVLKERVDDYLREAVAKMQSKIDNLGSITDGFWLEEGCPIGTVPIPKNARKNFKLDSSNFNANFNRSLERDPEKPIEFAGLVQSASQTFPYNGASAIMTVYNPYVDNSPDTLQYSTASILLENMDNQLQIGWMVSPSLFGDHQTRLYAAWRVNDDDNDICFNFHCQGFIQVDNKIPLGIILAPVSTIGHNPQYEQYFEIRKAPNGWEYYIGKEDDPSIVGYFPWYLFNNDLQKFGKVIKYGGQVYAPASDKTTPQMGSGHFLAGAFTLTSYMRHVKVHYNNSIVEDPNRESFIEQSRCYFAGSNGVRDASFWQYRLMFGGAGGPDADCHS